MVGEHRRVGGARVLSPGFSKEVFDDIHAFCKSTGYSIPMLAKLAVETLVSSVDGQGGKYEVFPETIEVPDEFINRVVTNTTSMHASSIADKLDQIPTEPPLSRDDKLAYITGRHATNWLAELQADFRGELGNL